MPSKSELKLAASLRTRKGRNESGLFAVEGLKSIQEAVRSGWDVQAVYATEGVDEAELGIQAERISVNDMSRITSLSSPSACYAIISSREYELSAFDPGGHWVWLDDLSDPGNVGTIIRTADWFGCKGILCSENTVDMYNPKVVQSTMGSIFRLPVIYGRIEEMAYLVSDKGCRLIGADMKGVSIHEFTFQPQDVLVIGNESRGISQVLHARMDQLVTIPGRGGAESLNASVAAGIIISRLSLV